MLENEKILISEINEVKMENDRLIKDYYKFLDIEKENYKIKL
jgi:hypothetical protein